MKVLIVLLTLFASYPTAMNHSVAYAQTDGSEDLSPKQIRAIGLTKDAMSTYVGRFTRKCSAHDLKYIPGDPDNTGTSVTVRDSDSEAIAYILIKPKPDDTVYVLDSKSGGYVKIADYKGK